MEIVLKQDIQGLGYCNDIVKVKPGYGRNYLIPQGLAVVANASNKKIALENSRQAAHKVEKQQKEAEVLAVQLGKLDIEIRTKVGENEKIFGSVMPAHLAKALEAQSVTIDRSMIRFERPIKTLGTHEATITLHKEVVHTLSFRVVAA